MKCCQPIRKLKANPYDIPGETLPFIVLGPDSPISYRKAARLLAEDFANNAHVSPAPYEPIEVEYYGGSCSPRDRVMLFGESIDSERIRCFGAVGIRWKKYDDLPEARWIMTWAWFHPSEQRKGHLATAWPHILRLFPNFIPLPPLTLAMKSFLKKIQFRDPLSPTEGVSDQR